jgi:lantibiotic modifying enzyme
MDGDLGVLVEVRGGAGDTHRGGRSVQIAIFSSGLQVVYKPRDLSVDRHFQELLSWLNARGDHPPFRPLKILNRGSHGWTEFIEVQGCTSTAEVWRFFDEPGMVSVQRHIHKLSDQDCARQLWFIRASLATLAKPGEGTRRRVFRPTERLAPAGHDGLVLAARKVGDRLEDLALKGGVDASYVGLVMAAPGLENRPGDADKAGDPDRCPARHDTTPSQSSCEP